MDPEQRDYLNADEKMRLECARLVADQGECGVFLVEMADDLYRFVSGQMDEPRGDPVNLSDADLAAIQRECARRFARQYSR